jgi:hypothetical protein
METYMKQLQLWYIPQGSRRREDSFGDCNPDPTLPDQSRFILVQVNSQISKRSATLSATNLFPKTGTSGTNVLTGLNKEGQFAKLQALYLFHVGVAP